MVFAIHAPSHRFPNLSELPFRTSFRHLVFFAGWLRNAFVTPLRYSIALVDQITIPRKVIWVCNTADWSQR